MTLPDPSPGDLACNIPGLAGAFHDHQAEARHGLHRATARCGHGLQTFRPDASRLGAGLTAEVSHG